MADIKNPAVQGGALGVASANANDPENIAGASPGKDAVVSLGDLICTAFEAAADYPRDTLEVAIALGRALLRRLGPDATAFLATAAVSGLNDEQAASLAEWLGGAVGAGEPVPSLNPEAAAESWAALAGRRELIAYVCAIFWRLPPPDRAVVLGVFGRGAA